MNIKSLYIIGYGQIKNKEIIFDENIKEFISENGSGKSTIVSFIKAMFYGLDSYKSTTKTFTDREHFRPLDGSLFGGNIIFIHDNKEYKIERTFDDKSGTSDTYKLYIDNSLDESKNSDFIKELLGIDKESFDRLFIITDKEIDIESTESITQKLSNILEGNPNLDLSDVIKKMEEKSKIYKRQSSNSLIQKEKDEIEELKNKVHNLESIKENLENKYNVLDDINKQIKELEKTQGETESRTIILKDYENLESKESDLEKLKQDLAILENKYNYNIPTFEDVKKLEEDVLKTESLNEKREQYSLSIDEKKDYNKYLLMFTFDVPSDEKLNKINQDIKEYDELNLSLKAQSLNLSKEDKDLINRFDLNYPNEDIIKKIENNLTTINNSNKNTTNNKKQNNISLIVLLSISIILLIASIPLFIFYKLVGIILLILSTLTLVLTGFLYLNNKTKDDNKKNTNNDLILETKSLLIKYITLTDNLDVDFHILKESLSRYNNIKNDIKENEEKTSNIKNRINSLKEELVSSFDEYGILSDNFIDSLNELKISVSKYNTLRIKTDGFKASLESIQNEVELHEKMISIFKNKYKISTINKEYINSIKTDLIRFEHLKKEIDEGKKRIEEFKNDKSLTTKPDLPIFDLDEIKNKLNDLRNKYSYTSNEIRNDETSLEDLERFKDLIVYHTDLLKSYKKKYEIYKKTIEFINLSLENIKNKYVKPIKESFIFYSSKIKDVLGIKVLMDKDFRIYYERNGKTIKEKYFSEGERIIIAFAFRLALLDNMYVNRPFIILDDPFQSLDSNNFSNMKALINKLKDDRQIIYFSCHESRKIN